MFKHACTLVACVVISAAAVASTGSTNTVDPNGSTGQPGASKTNPTSAVQTTSNLYGRAEVKALVGSDRATTPFYLTSYVNPSGSRNLEYNSLQDVVQSSAKKP